MVKNLYFRALKKNFDLYFRHESKIMVYKSNMKILIYSELGV